MKLKALFIAIATLSAGYAAAADPAKIDWDAVPVKTVTLFYPGQSSLEWLTSKAHKGASKVKAGQACVSCHDGANEEKELGDKLVKAGPLEPMPVAGKNGWVDLHVQAAYDDKNAYMRFQWKTQNPFPGTEHQYLRSQARQSGAGRQATRHLRRPHDRHARRWQG